MAAVFHARGDSGDADFWRIDEHIDHGRFVAELLRALKRFDVHQSREGRFNCERSPLGEERFYTVERLFACRDLCLFGESRVQFARNIVRVDKLQSLARQKFARDCRFAAAVRSGNQIEMFSHRLVQVRCHPMKTSCIAIHAHNETSGTHSHQVLYAQLESVRRTDDYSSNCQDRLLCILTLQNASDKREVVDILP